MDTLVHDGTTRYIEIARADGGVGRIAYDDRGEGPLVLLAPGMGTVRSTFRHLVPELTAAGYRVVTTDYRGLGESDTGWDEYSSAATAQDLAALIRHLAAGPALLYGNSYTAASSVHLAADQPELLRADFDAIRAAVDANLREPGRAAVLARMSASGHHAAEAKLAGARAAGLPTLVVMGTADEDFPDALAEARFVARSLGGGLEPLEGHGHQPHEEAPADVAELILALDPAGPRRV